MRSVGDGRLEGRASSSRLNLLGPFITNFLHIAERENSPMKDESRDINKLIQMFSVCVISSPVSRWCERKTSCGPASIHPQMAFLINSHVHARRAVVASRLNLTVVSFTGHCVGKGEKKKFMAGR